MIYFWLCWIFVSVWGLSLVAASGGHSSLQCAGLSLSRPLLLRSTGSRRAGSVVVAHGPSCSTACGIFPGQGSNPCPLHWQADSQPLRHQGSPPVLLLIWMFLINQVMFLFYSFIFISSSEDNEDLSVNFYSLCYGLFIQFVVLFIWESFLSCWVFYWWKLCLDEMGLCDGGAFW